MTKLTPRKTYDPDKIVLVARGDWTLDIYFIHEGKSPTLFISRQSMGNPSAPPNVENC